MILEREQHYLDLFMNTEIPTYNILKKAGSLLGHIHTPEFRAKMSEGNIAVKGNIAAARSRVSASQKGKIRSADIKAKISKTKGTAIYVYSADLKLENTFFSNKEFGASCIMLARESAKFFNVSSSTIMRYVRDGRLLSKNGFYLYLGKHNAGSPQRNKNLLKSICLHPCDFPAGKGSDYLK